MSSRTLGAHGWPTVLVNDSDLVYVGDNAVVFS